MPILSQLTKAAYVVVRPNPLKILAAWTNVFNKQSQLLDALDIDPLVPKRGLKTSSFTSRSVLSDPENKKTRQTGVNFDVLGSWNHHLKLDVNVPQSVKRGSLVPRITLKHVGCATVLGRRKHNEDRFVACEVRPGLMMFAVFDGHGGDAAAQYSEDHMIDHIRFWLDRGERDIEKVLKNAFTDLNNLFTRSLYKRQIASGSDGLSSGTTATVCLLQDDLFLYVGHVGDSRAILCREGKAIKMTREHTPDDESERNRILAAGGHVTWSSIGRPRVNGRLEMTRSIGDMELKASGVSADADTTKITIRHSHDAFLVLCTDGVHHVLTSQQIVDVIASSRDPHEAAKFTADQALLFSSDDNCTTVVVPFGSWGKFASKTFKSSFTRSMIGSRVD